MKKRELSLRRSLWDTVAGVSAAAIALGLAGTETARGCACGCGMFDVGTTEMLPVGPGGMVYVNGAFQDQKHNWSGSSSAPAADNADKEISTSFITPGAQYFFNRSWGVNAALPMANRYFKTAGGATGSDNVALNWWSLGDLRLNVQYTGFSPTMATGVSLGLKLPTGDFHHNDAFGDIDRDTEIGTGSTDLLLGGFHRGFVPGGFGLGWFGQVELNLPVFTQEQYRPGLELDASIGVNYTHLQIGRLRISPIAQVIGSFRTADTGANASGGALDDTSGVGSGYERILLSPGVDFDLHPWHFYADVEIPVYQRVNGNQLVSSELFKCGLSYTF